MTAIAPENVTGRTETHLCSQEDAALFGARMHRDVTHSFILLRQEAATAGFDLRIDSGFRSFDRQVSLWDRKANGQLAVLDSNGAPLDIASMSEHEVVYAILRWSALPGASRHHWGTDLDVFDERARPAGYEVDLIPGEVEAGGMFAPLHEWLDERIAAGSSFGFFRPYDRDRQGVAPERWHLSHAPVATGFEQRLSVPILRAALETSDLQLKNAVLEHLEDIYRRFVINTNRGEL